MKLALVSLHIKNSPQAMPLATGMLKASLDAASSLARQLETVLMDFYVENSAASLVKALLDSKADCVGFSTYLWNRDLVIQVAELLHAQAPQIRLFAGGAEASAAPSRLLTSGPFEFVIKGEGEVALVEVVSRMLRSASLAGIAGVLLPGQPSEPEASFIADLDQLPSPYLNKVLIPSDYEGLLWELSRGCPFKCDFCFESRGVAGVRRFALDRLRQELTLFESQGVSQIFVLDPTFNQDKKRAKSILRMIKEIAPQIHFTFEVRTEFLDEEMAVLFGSIHCSLQIGLQSAVPDVLRLVNRQFNADTFKNKIGLLNDAGVIFGLDLIYGLPGDSLAGFKKSLDYAIERQPNHLDVFALAVLPGTVLYDNRQKLELEYLKQSPYTVLSSPSFSAGDLALAKSLADSCDVFYNQGGAVGWLFMILETLRLRPSVFFEQFAQWLSDAGKRPPFAREAVTALQLAFVETVFDKHGKKKLFPVMKNLISYHAGLDLSLYAGASPAPQAARAGEPRSVYKLSPGTFLLTLDYNLDGLLELGEITILQFLSEYKPEKTFVVVFNCAGEVKSIMFESVWFQLLKAFNGKTPLAQLSGGLSPQNKKDLKEFIEYALGEGILTAV